jgi:hypothetical protein
MADEDNAESEKLHDSAVYLQRISRDMRKLVNIATELMAYVRDAESEVPEKMRRFIMYSHDVHDMMTMHRETGMEPPEHVKAEARRCDDRFRQILNEMHTDGGAFEKVRQQMAADPENRWDHTRQLGKPKEIKE